jgi:hypothetical protein
LQKRLTQLTLLTHLLGASADAAQGWHTAAAMAAVLIALVAVGAIGFVRFWRVVATYARSEALPPDMAER